MLILALGISFALALGVLLPREDKGAEDRNSSVEGSPRLVYEFRVYPLDATTMTRTQNGTVFSFDVSDLPFDFNSIYFGDFRLDNKHSHIYYAGSGIRVNATGANATVTLKEGNGKAVSRIDYHGQDQILFNGWIESVTYPGVMTTYNGTDLMVQDWRIGSWAPNDGILVEHPTNVTPQSASFFLMAFEPQIASGIPEFSTVVTPVVTLTTLVVMQLLMGHRRSLDLQ